MQKRWMSILGLAILVLFALPVAGQEFEAFGGEQGAPVPDAVMEAQTAFSPTPSMDYPDWQAEPPQLTAEQKARLEWALDHTHLSPALPAMPGGFGELDPATESHVSDLPALTPGPGVAPTDRVEIRKRTLIAQVPNGYNSSVMEASIAGKGRFLFYTGNWFAARSSSGGAYWSYVNPYSGFPGSPGAGFCCDQVTIAEPSRNLIFWLRMGSPDGSGNNVFRIGNSLNGGVTWCNYDFTATNVNAGFANTWFDYPHMAVGADFLYITWNMFNAGGSFVRTLIMRLPLDAMQQCVGFGYNYYNGGTSYFSLVPAHGMDHTAWFGTNWKPSAFSNTTFWILKWEEKGTGLSAYTRTIPAWGTGQANCGVGLNWLGRVGPRVTAGARYRMNGTSVAKPGLNVLGWWWTVGQGGSFSEPYIEGVAFYEDTVALVAGSQGRPYIYSSSTCFAYPSAAPNNRGDLGVVFNFDSGATKEAPSIGWALADDLTGTPPGWIYVPSAYGNALPSDQKWGDYNTIRKDLPGGNHWIIAAHWIPGGTNCTACTYPLFVVIGRYRDYWDWWYWQNK